MIDYKWTADSIVMASTQLAEDVLAAVRHAMTVPGEITPSQADRLHKLADKIEDVLSVIITAKRVDAAYFRDWGSACGQAVRESLNGAESVVVVDMNGLRYNVLAEPVEDNS